MTRSSAGRMAYHSGEAAERQIAQDYERRGFAVARRRWRVAGGEIDLITRNEEGIVFLSRSSRRATYRRPPGDSAPGRCAGSALRPRSFWMVSRTDS
ncbi:YraN family protein [Jhaorihella thermophila]